MKEDKKILNGRISKRNIFVEKENVHFGTDGVMDANKIVMRQGVRQEMNINLTN